MRIESVSAQPDRVGRYRVSFEDGTVMKLYRQTVEDYSLYSGKELEEHTLAQLRQAAGEMSAKMRAVRIVSASGVSKADLLHRLIQKGETQTDAERAVQWMQELSVLDDRETAFQVVQSVANKGYGIARAKQTLYEKRIPKQYWEEALSDYPDQQEHILAFLRSRYTDEPKQKRKLIDALLRRGHSYCDIRRAMEQLDMDADDFREEF